MYPVDFHQPAAKQDIDAWAKRQTADRIQKVFDEIDPDTALVLANTVYLKGDWRTAFEKTSTSDADFHRADGSTVQVPTMHAQMRVGYAEGDGWQAVELPYGEDGTFAMRIVVPTGSMTPGELLAPEVLSAVGSGLESQLVDLALPRWDFASDIALRDELIRLGIPSAFDADLADLSGMSPVRLYLAQAVHRATITVDEFGTEAAAVTAFAAAPTSAPRADRDAACRPSVRLRDRPRADRSPALPRPGGRPVRALTPKIEEESHDSSAAQPSGSACAADELRAGPMGGYAAAR